MERHKIKAENVDILEDGCYTADSDGNIITYVFRDHRTGRLYERGVGTPAGSPGSTETYGTLTEMMDALSSFNFYTLDGKLVTLKK